MNSTGISTPIAFFIFNRPDLTRIVFQAIRRVRPPKLLLVADGARQERPNERELCLQAQQVVNQVDWPCEILLNVAPSNMGCRRRVSSGVSWVFDMVSEAIILEDDCLPDPSFFPFCEELLARYRDDERIGMISGDNFLEKRRSQYSYYFTRHTHIWGWASWRRAWRHYDPDLAIWPQVRAEGWLSDYFNGNEALARHWESCFQNMYDGKIDTWDYQWTFTCWMQNFLTVNPTVNLISNLGFRSDATHTTVVTGQSAMNVQSVTFPLKHPPIVVRDAAADEYTDKNIFGVAGFMPSQRTQQFYNG